MPRTTKTRTRRRLELSEALRESVPRLRKERGWTQEELAAQAFMWGLTDWDHHTVKNIEAGARSLNIAELFILLVIFRVNADEFFEGIDTVVLSPEFPVVPGSLGRILEGDLAGYPPIYAERQRQRQLADAERRLAEQKAARALGVGVLEVVRAAQRLWGRSLTTERELRLVQQTGILDLSPPSRQARRGHITRQLLKELRGAGLGVPAPKRKKKG